MDETPRNWRIISNEGDYVIIKLNHICAYFFCGDLVGVNNNKEKESFILRTNRDEIKEAQEHFGFIRKGHGKATKLVFSDFDDYINSFRPK